LAGQCCNVAVVLDMSKYMHHVLEIDSDKKLGRVQAGCVLDDLRTAAERYHLTFGPDPATHNHCTLGGMVGNNSCGIHSLIAVNAGLGERTADNTHELEVLTYDGLRLRVGPTGDEDLEQIIRAGGRRGDIYRQLKALRDTYAHLIRDRFPKLPRRVSGYNLDELLPEKGFNVARALVGSESTCVVVLEATMHLIPSPAHRALLVLGYPDVFAAGDHVPEILQFRPTGLEGIDQKLFEWVKQAGTHTSGIELMPSGHGFLLVEFGGDTRQDACGPARECMEKLKKDGHAPAMKLYANSREMHAIWQVRESGLGSTAWVPGQPDTWPGWEDSAVPPEKVGNYLRDLRQLMQRYDYHPSLYGHFGQGCIHCRIGFDLYTADGIQKYRSFVEEAADLVVKYGGSLSGEHGDGQARGELLPKMFGDELMQAFREFKSIWDPDWKMNPGKVVAPYRLDQNLRLGPDYAPSHPKTHFQFPADKYDFARAALRCVGVGECRKEGNGTMCPSYMVTREEMHSTRGRAHLLFEMLQQTVIGKQGWRDEHVKEALHLCLACKGCKGECPVKVDMATYKAEFLSHYYAGRSRPRSAYAFGLIFWWARLASLLPEVVNFCTQTPLLRDLAKAVAGVAPERQVPRFAPQTFQSWFFRRPPRNQGKRRVILWPDTFNNHFHPEVAKAAVEVLEAADCQVVVPQRFLCCGRPLYDYGMLDLARHQLRQILNALRSEIRAGTPIVGLEPSCTAVFRDELCELFPHDQDASRLREQTFTLGEFLTKQGNGNRPPSLRRKAVVHGHCHHKAIMKMEAEEQVLGQLGLDFEVLDAGCCGMAGSFGFEKGDRYEVSMKCGERVLLPAVREAAKDTLIIADGFSCRTQIAQATDRHALHLAQVLQIALHDRAPAIAPYPEERYVRQARLEHQQAQLQTALFGIGALLAGAAVVWALRRGSRRI
jgi:FAD/FMN-containing dehydrogenase/Fe-S oxidoreductase